jgi:hypothetical protein
MSKQALQPIEQKTVIFYDDEITAVRLSTGEVFVPIRPICDNLGLNLGGQRERINRDPVLSEDVSTVRVTRTEGDRAVARELLCLSLKYIPGWLFGINANRVKPEIRDRLIRYQRECYDVLSEAFQEGRLTADPTFDELLQTVDSEAVQAYRMLQALTKLARSHILLEGRVAGTEARLEAIEEQLSDPARKISPAQATHLSQAVKAVAMALSKASGRNEYGGVYGELYRRYEVPSYRELPAAKYDDVMTWLNDWLQSISDKNPF